MAQRTTQMGVTKRLSYLNSYLHDLRPDLNISLGSQNNRWSLQLEVAGQGGCTTISDWVPIGMLDTVIGAASNLLYHVKKPRDPHRLPLAENPAVFTRKEGLRLLKAGCTCHVTYWFDCRLNTDSFTHSEDHAYRMRELFDKPPRKRK